MKYLINILLIFISFNVLAFSDDEICSVYKDLAKEWNKKMPMKADEYTENFFMDVNCPNKVVTYKKRILVDHNVFKVGWEQRFTEQHNQLHCMKDGVASLAKWTAASAIYSVDFEYIKTFITTPKDCN